MHSARVFLHKVSAVAGNEAKMPKHGKKFLQSKFTKKDNRYLRKKLASVLAIDREYTYNNKISGSMFPIKHYERGIAL